MEAPYNERNSFRYIWNTRETVPFLIRTHAQANFETRHRVKYVTDIKMRTLEMPNERRTKLL